MAEFNYFCTIDELAGLIQNAVRNGYRAQINEQASEPKRSYCETEEDVLEAIRRGAKGFLLERFDISRHAVVQKCVSRDDKRFWYLRSKEGGPVIEVLFWAPYEKNGRSIVPCALLAFHSIMQNPNTGKIEAAGEGIKKAYRQLITALRKEARKVISPLANRTAYVSPGVDRMLESGWELADPFCILSIC